MSESQLADARAICKVLCNARSRNADRTAEGQAGDPKVLSHVDMENKRVKEVTDAIMYDLLPAAIACATQEIDEVAQDLTWESCQVSNQLELCPGCLSESWYLPHCSPCSCPQHSLCGCSMLLEWHWWLRACSMLHQAFWSSSFASHGDTLESFTQGSVLKSAHMASSVMLSQLICWVCLFHLLL